MNLDFVNVNVRIKPPPKRKPFKNAIQVISTNPAVLLSVDKQITYNFDNIFSEDSSQEDVYNKSVRPFVLKVKEGYNCTIFAYGQTGTGKTYTMGTNPDKENKGIISRALEDFFSCENTTNEFDVHISFMEIYNEKVFDLLKKDKNPLAVKGMRVEGLCTQKVFNIYEANHFLELGGKNRHTGETKQNLFSSRSHAIFSIHYTVDDGYKHISAKLNLVDLAGSEGVKKTGTCGNSFQEGININKGLLCIGQVMTALTANLPYVPYRQSIITTILQDSLNRNNYISLIACVKCDYADTTETIQTLEFTQRVKKMKNKPEVNEVLARFRAENPDFFEKSDRVSCTPVRKRGATPAPLRHQFKTPCRLTDLNNLSVPVSTVLDYSKSVVSLSSASNSDVGSNFSPVIRKYMNKLENTIIEKLQTVIQTTIKQTTRSSRRLSTVVNEENTPKYSWNDIQQKILSYNSPCLEENKIFVIPGNTSRNSTPCVSPINSTSPENMDIVFKKPIVPCIRNIGKSSVSTCDMLPRSTRLHSIHTSILDESKTKTNIDKSLVFPNENTRERRSTRLSRRHSAILDGSTTSLSSHKTLKKSRGLRNIKLLTSEYQLMNVNESPKTGQIKMDNSRRKQAAEVLALLNNGDKKQLQKLATIGPKTAERILLFRHFKGGFCSVEELSEMPGWSNKLYLNFMEQNFLKS